MQNPTYSTCESVRLPTPSASQDFSLHVFSVHFHLMVRAFSSSESSSSSLTKGHVAKSSMLLLLRHPAAAQGSPGSPRKRGSVITGPGCTVMSAVMTLPGRGLKGVNTSPTPGTGWPSLDLRQVAEEKSPNFPRPLLQI